MKRASRRLLTGSATRSRTLSDNYPANLYSILVTAVAIAANRRCVCVTHLLYRENTFMETLLNNLYTKTFNPVNVHKLIGVEKYKV